MGYSMLTQPQRVEFHEEGYKIIQRTRQAHCGYIECNNPLDYGMLGVERYFCSKCIGIEYCTKKCHMRARSKDHSHACRMNDLWKKWFLEAHVLAVAKLQQRK